MSSDPPLPPGVFPNLEETNSPFLDTSLCDLEDLWPLLNDDPENLVNITHPDSRNTGNIYSPASGANILSSAHLQAANINSENTDLIIVGDQLAETRDTAVLAEPSGQLGFRCRGESTYGGNGKGHIISHSESGEGATDRLVISRRKRMERRGLDRGVRSDDEEGSVANKKRDHNAKERARRVELNAAYSALGSLLPAQYRRSEKRWSAAMIVDRVVEYISELKRDIEDLTSEKEKMTLQHRAEAAKYGIPSRSDPEPNDITVSVHEVGSAEEVIIQICMKEGEGDRVFSSMLSRFESEELLVLGGSTLHVGEDRVCFHFHVQRDGGSSHGPVDTKIFETKANIVATNRRELVLK